MAGHAQPAGSAPAPSPASGPGKPRKRLYRRWWFWALAALLVAAVGIGGSLLATGALDPTTPEASEPTTPTTLAIDSVPSTATASADASTKTPTVVPSEPEADPELAAQAPSTKTPKGWTRVVGVRGVGTKRSAPFKLTGNAALLKYTVKQGPGLVDIYVLEEGAGLDEGGATPVVMALDAGSGELELALDAGTYHLEVVTSDGEWTVIIEQEQ